MRALVLRDWWDLVVEDRPDPSPGSGEVMMRVTATGICGSDVHGFTGESGRRGVGQVMGHETVGRIEAVGPLRDDRQRVEAGAVATVLPVVGCDRCGACRSGASQRCGERRVIGVTPDIPAAFAEYVLVPAANVVALPAAMPEEYGALVEPLAVGYHAAVRGGCGAGDAVVVIGAGPIGQACVLAARRLGVGRIAVTEPDPHRRDLATRLGVSAIDASAGVSSEDVADALGTPATLALDAVGTTSSIADALRCVEPGGRVVLVGMGTPEPSVPAYAISTEERSVLGSFCYSPAEFRETAEWVGSAPVELRELVDGRVDLDAAGGAFTRLARGESAASKVLVYPHGVPAEVTAS